MRHMYNIHIAVSLISHVDCSTFVFYRYCVYETVYSIVMHAYCFVCQM